MASTSRFSRTVAALMMREMSTTYGRSALGYLWAILEPAGGIFLLTLIFSIGFRNPSIGTNFAIFFASGVLPFMVYMGMSARITSAIRFSKALLFYPGVTFVDAIIARLLLNTITEVMIAFILLSAIITFYDLKLILDFQEMALAYLMSISLALGIGTLNCYLFFRAPSYGLAWGVLMRPMFLLSCVIFLFEDIPMPYRDWLWFNPLVHIVGTMRAGIFATYDASYVSPVYVFSIAIITGCLGLAILRRYYREILND